MHDTAAIDALRERVAGLSGSDREVDAAIGAAFRWHPFGPHHWLNRSPEAIFKPTINGWMCFSLPGEDAPRDAWSAPAYTASIDAALALVERVLPGIFWLVGKGRTTALEKLHACQLMFGTDEIVGEGEADTPELAIILALLSALKETDHA